MLEAAFWGLVSGGALVVGAVLALALTPRSLTVGMVMAFGAGVLISAVAYELVEEAFRTAEGFDVVAAGLAAGALTFFLGDALIDRRGGTHRKRLGGPPGGAAAGAAPPGATGQAIVLGSVLDGIPESIIVGISLLDGTGVSVAVVAAVFLSNLPEAIAGTDQLRRAGTPRGRILGVWVALALVSAAAAALGYGVVGRLPGATAAFVQAFAGGALLTMLGDTMIPEAHAQARRVAGLCLVLGFALAFALSAVDAAAG